MAPSLGKPPLPNPSLDFQSTGLLWKQRGGLESYIYHARIESRNAGMINSVAPLCREKCGGDRKMWRRAAGQIAPRVFVAGEGARKGWSCSKPRPAVICPSIRRDLSAHPPVCPRPRPAPLRIRTPPGGTKALWRRWLKILWRPPSENLHYRIHPSILNPPGIPGGILNPSEFSGSKAIWSL